MRSAFLKRARFLAWITTAFAFLWVATAAGEELPAQIVPQLGHSERIDSVAYSPDGRTLASGSFDKTIKLWDATSGRLIRTLEGHGNWVNSVAFSPDGRTLASGSWDKTIKLWDAASGRLIKTLQGHGDAVASVAYSPDGRTLASGSGDNTIKLWDVTSGRLIRTLEGHGDAVASVAYSPDGRTLASGSGDNTIKLWDPSSGQLIRTLKGHGSLVNSVAYSPDGRTLASGSNDKTIKLWDAASGRLIRTLEGHGGSVYSVAYSPDGRTLASGSNDRTIKLWDAESGRLIDTLGYHDRPVTSVAFSPGGRMFASGGWDQTIMLWDAESGGLIRVLQGHGNQVRSVAFSPDGRTLASGSWDKTIKLWDATSGRLIRTLQGHGGRVTSIAFSPDGRTLASGSWDKTIKLWDATSGRLIRTLQGHGDAVASVAYSPDGRTLASGSGDNTIKLWDPSSGQLIRTLKGHGSLVNSVAYSPDGRTLASGSNDKTIKLWDAASGRLIRMLEGNGDLVNSVAFSPDGRTLASGSDDKTIQLWDAASGRLIRTLQGHFNRISSIAFSQDGRSLASGSEDHTIKLWGAQTGQLLASGMSGTDGSWLVLTPEGFFDTSDPQAASNLLSLVRGYEVFSIDQVYNALYRPDLVREKLAGDPSGKVRAAAAQLNLDKVMASGMAPKVVISSPASGSSAATDEVVVEATTIDQGGGIGKVEWRVNDVTLGLESRGLDRLETSPGGAVLTQTVKRTVSLEPGDNRIEVLAYNAKGLIASEPAQITVKWDGAKTAARPNLYVLAVGVNDYYDGRLHLAYAVPDATALAEGFKKAGSDLYGSVDVRTVLDSDVTLTNLDKVFAELSTKVQPRDVFVFFLAGHGKTKNGRYYFLPRDFHYEDESSIEKAGMGQDKFQAWFAEIPARKSLLLYDTCESGSLTGVNARGSDIDERLGALNRMARATGRTFLTATTDDAPALEGFHGHGVFTYALLDALDHADVNHDGLIEVSELADYIDQKVPDYSFEAFKLRQIPQRSIVGNNFALTNKAEVLLTSNTSSKNDSDPVPPKPTHVVVAPVDVKNDASDSAVTVTHLAAGTQVRLMEIAGGWVLIARDGQKLGYVQASALAGLQ